jgi:hypothetical protein
LKALETDVKNQKQEIKNRLCAMLGDNEIGLVGEGEDTRKVSWKTIPGKVTVDSEKLRQKNRKSSRSTVNREPQPDGSQHKQGGK